MYAELLLACPNDDFARTRLRRMRLSWVSCINLNFNYTCIHHVAVRMAGPTAIKVSLSLSDFQTLNSWLLAVHLGCDGRRIVCRCVYKLCSCVEHIQEVVPVTEGAPAMQAIAG